MIKTRETESNKKVNLESLVKDAKEISDSVNEYHRAKKIRIQAELDLLRLCKYDEDVRFYEKRGRFNF